MEVRRPVATHQYTISWYRPLETEVPHLQLTLDLGARDPAPYEEAQAEWTVTSERGVMRCVGSK
jgi:hypothetical protein